MNYSKKVVKSWIYVHKTIPDFIVILQLYVEVDPYNFILV